MAVSEDKSQVPSAWEKVKFDQACRALLTGRYDDRMHDDEWILDNSRRAYRIRSVRPSDNAWWFVTDPAILVVNTRTHESLFVPPTGWPVPPMDDDAWGRAVFAARDIFEAENA